MSIIERAANILGEASSSPSKAAPKGEEVMAPDADLIERAVANDGRSAEFSKVEESTAAKDHKFVSSPSTVRGGLMVNINLDKLRHQNIIVPDSMRTPMSESFRRIKRQILAKMDAKPGRNLIMVTSALPGEGKTFCTTNLAISVAMEMDRTVLLVDADVARPTIPKVLGIEGEGQGLMDVILDRNIDLAGVLRKTNIEKLSILLAGTPHRHATEMLASEALHALLEEMAQRYRDRVIIFDSPPLLVASESCVLANRMGQIIVVVEAWKTTETTLKDALGRIESSNIAGLLLNKGAAPGSGFGDGYGYGYDYG